MAVQVTSCKDVVYILAAPLHVITIIKHLVYF